MPVSYTHLDVYKRQMQTLLDSRATAPELRQCIENLAILGARGGAAGLVALSVTAAVLQREGLAKLAYEPVSYTHLDVYKRQLIDREHAVCEHRGLAHVIELRVDRGEVWPALHAVEIV